MHWQDEDKPPPVDYIIVLVEIFIVAYLIMRLLFLDINKLDFLQKSIRPARFSALTKGCESFFYGNAQYKTEQGGNPCAVKKDRLMRTG